MFAKRLYWRKLELNGDCALLYLLIRRYYRRHAFEIGTFTGTTAIAMNKVLRKEQARLRPAIPMIAALFRQRLAFASSTRPAGSQRALVLFDQTWRLRLSCFALL